MSRNPTTITIKRAWTEREWLATIYGEDNTVLAIGGALTPSGALQRAWTELYSEARPKDYGIAFKRIRERRRISVKSAADTLHTTQANIRRMESGETEQSPEQWRSWARDLGISAPDFEIQLRDVVRLRNAQEQMV